jgi:hypothetical protein
MRYLTDDWKSDLHKLGMGGAWLFFGGSALALLWLIFNGGGWSGHVLGTTVHGHSYTAPLLAYSGFFGMVWIWAQLAAVLAGGALSLMPWPRQRQIGHVILVCWSGLWMIGAMRLLAVQPSLFWTLQTMVMGGFCACTVYRAIRGWNPPEVPQTFRVDSDPSASDDPLRTDLAHDEPRVLQAGDIGRSERMFLFTQKGTNAVSAAAKALPGLLQRLAKSVANHVRAAHQTATPKVKAALVSARRSLASMMHSA